MSHGPAELPVAATEFPVPKEMIADAPRVLPRAIAAVAGVPQRSRTAAPQPAPAAREETVVHVTIGRVEVRAVAPPVAPPPPRPQAAPPGEALAAWLARRSRS